MSKSYAFKEYLHQPQDRLPRYVHIEYESAKFQTGAYSKLYLTWTRAAHSWPYSGSLGSYSFELSKIMVQSEAPFASLREHSPAAGRDTDPPWAGVELSYNTVAKQVPVAIHLTGDKRFRKIWWHKLWLQGYGEKLRLGASNATMREREDEAARLSVGGYERYNAEAAEAVDLRLWGLRGA